MLPLPKMPIRKFFIAVLLKVRRHRGADGKQFCRLVINNQIERNEQAIQRQ
jgi:hypothetical protein